ncbi:MAG: M3 family oligoendopeptidase [Candidatus Sericytochromatia bacterium]|nr:M3 family oligoendopeptidase [Candidatus Sericytochromatia bacterium]
MIPVVTLAPPQPWSAEELKARYHTLKEDLPHPDAPADEWEAWYWRWNEMRASIQGEMARRYFRECQDTQDTHATAAWREMCEHFSPIAQEEDGILRKAFLNAHARAELQGRMGQQLFLLLGLEDASFAVENVALQVEESDLVSQYDHLMGGARIQLTDETLTLSRAQAELTSPFSERRRAVWDAMGDWFEGQAEQIHAILDRLIRLRQKQASNLGEHNFIPVGYRRMGRTEYGPTEVQRFRDAILQHIVPLSARLRAKQARDLGHATGLLPGCDMTFYPGGTIGPQAVPVQEQTARAGQVFERLHPRFAAHWRQMLKDGLIDLENRPGKKPGAFAMSLDDEQRVAIFCNSTGAESDISTLHHEMGHAVQAWESMWIKPLELRTPTMDAAEIHSFGMEYLALDEVEAYFSPGDAAKFKNLRLMTTLARLPYMACVDAFQHFLYEKPDATPAEREAHWEALWNAFMPGLEMSDCPRQRQFRWMRQSHIFATPFYYIDYALAEVAALQLWQRAKDDRPGATQAYMEMCRVGGSVSLLGVLKAGGLSSPFETEVLGPIVRQLAEELKL